VASVVAVALVLAGLAAAPLRRPDFWFEAAKAGLQLGVVVIVGGLVGYALRHLESEREARRSSRGRLDEYRLGLVRDLVTAYNEVKAVRRTLRAYGFSSPEPGVTLKTDQIAEFQRQMESLMWAQLSLERIQREIKAQGQVFGADADDLMKMVDRAQRYVNDVIKDWETSGAGLIVDEDARTTMSKFTHLQDFLASAKGPESRFKAKLSEPLGKAGEILQRHHLAGRQVGVTGGD